MNIGDSATFSKTISESDVYTFAGITGDFNPLHVNETKAKNTIFKSRIVHGMLVGSFISTVLGTKFPGPGTIYLEQDLVYKKPVYINDTVTAIVTLSEVIDAEKNIYKFDTIIVNDDNEKVIEGYAVVKVNRLKECENASC